MKRLILRKNIPTVKMNELYSLFQYTYVKTGNNFSLSHSLVNLNLNEIFNDNEFSIKIKRNFDVGTIRDLDYRFVDLSYIVSFDTSPRLLKLYDNEAEFFEYIKFENKDKIIEFENCQLVNEEW